MVTNVRLHVRVIERGKHNRLLAEEYYSLRNLQEGEQRTETLSLKSLIKANSVLEVELTGTEITPQVSTLEMQYRKTR
jgi:VCBS repeat-containing protein